MSIECDCPLCPLVAVNMQICDVVVKFKTTGYVVECCKNDTEKIAGLQCHFVWLATTARNNYKLKKGQCWDEERRSDCKFYIECLRKNQFKVCFHTKPTSSS